MLRQQRAPAGDVLLHSPFDRLAFESPDVQPFGPGDRRLERVDAFLSDLECREQSMARFLGQIPLLPHAAGFFGYSFSGVDPGNHEHFDPRSVAYLGFALLDTASPTPEPSPVALVFTALVKSVAGTAG